MKPVLPAVLGRVDGSAVRDADVQGLPARRVLVRAGLGLGLGAGLGLLAGCGFALRRPPTMAFRSIAFVGFAPRSPMAAELRRQLAGQVQVVEAPAQAEVVLQALSDDRLRSVVASTAAAQVREIQLRVRFHFRAATPAGKELIPRAELLLSRDLSFNETAALAKEQEEAELFRAMQSDVVAQVLRRLASVNL